MSGGVGKNDGLVREAGEGEFEFLFMSCATCGTLTFPAPSYGCRSCGAPLVSGHPTTRPAQARLLNFVTVHVPIVPGMTVPQVIGEVELLPGVVERVRVDIDDENRLRVGMTVRLVTRPEQSADTAVSPVEWLFEPIEAVP